MHVTILHPHPIHSKDVLFTALALLGIEVDIVFAARFSILRTASEQPVGSSYRSFFLSEGSFESLPQVRTAMRAVKVFEECCPDVVIICGYSYLPTWTVLAWAKACRKPVVLWFQSNVFDHPRLRVKEAIKSVFVRACDVAHVYGKSNREYLERLGVKHSAIFEKKATMDCEMFLAKRASFHKGFRRFVYVGRFAQEKNLPRLLEAFCILRDTEHAELVLVGHGPEEAALRSKVRVLNLDDSITFAGAKTQVEVSQALAECDCLVLPSLSEPWGLVANEALCTGIPIIVSDRCGCAADLVTQDTGWLVEAEDTQKLAEAMAAVCRLPIQHLEKMGEAAVKMVCDYSPEACAHRIIGNLEDILQSKGTAR